MSEPVRGARNDSLAGWVATHRFLVILNLACVLFGLALAWFFLPEWPAWKSLLAGSVAGGGCGFLVTCTRLVGGSID